MNRGDWIVAPLFSACVDRVAPCVSCCLPCGVAVACSCALLSRLEPRLSYRPWRVTSTTVGAIIKDAADSNCESLCGLLRTRSVTTAANVADRVVPSYRRQGAHLRRFDLFALTCVVGFD